MENNVPKHTHPECVMVGEWAKIHEQFTNLEKSIHDAFNSQLIVNQNFTDQILRLQLQISGNEGEGLKTRTSIAEASITNLESKINWLMGSGIGILLSLVVIMVRLFFIKGGP